MLLRKAISFALFTAGLAHQNALAGDESESVFECKPEYVKAAVSGVMNKSTLLKIAERKPISYKALTASELKELIATQNSPLTRLTDGTTPLPDNGDPDNGGPDGDNGDPDNGGPDGDNGDPDNGGPDGDNGDPDNDGPDGSDDGEQSCEPVALEPLLIPILVGDITIFVPVEQEQEEVVCDTDSNGAQPTQTNMATVANKSKTNIKSKTSTKSLLSANIANNIANITPANASHVLFEKNIDDKRYQVAHMKVEDLLERINRVEQIIADYGISVRNIDIEGFDISNWYLEPEYTIDNILGRLRESVGANLKSCVKDVVQVVSDTAQEGSAPAGGAPIPQAPVVTRPQLSDQRLLSTGEAKCSVPVIEGALQGEELGPEILRDITGRTPIEFRPFTSDEVRDAIDSEIARNPASQLMTYNDNDTPEVNDDIIEFLPLTKTEDLPYSPYTPTSVAQMSVGTWLSQMNAMEAQINEFGFSLRNGTDDLNVWHLYTDPDVFKEQILAEMKLIATDTIKACIDNIQFENCPQLNLNDVTRKLNVAPNERITLPNGSRTTVSDLVWSVNNGIKLACAVVDVESMETWLPSGYTIKLPEVNLPDVDLPDVDLPDVDLPDIDLPDVELPEFALNASYDFELFRRLNGRAQIEIPEISLDQFKLDMIEFLDGLVVTGLGLDTAALHRIFEMGRGLMENAERWLADKLRLDNTAEWINNFKTRLQLEGKLGNIKAIPVVEEPQYPRLEIKKRKEWPGFNVGNKDLLHSSANAYLRLYGSDRAQAVVGYGKVDATIFNQTFNVVSAVGEFFVGDQREASKAIFEAYTNPDDGGSGEEEHNNNTDLSLEDDVKDHEGIAILSRYELRLLDQVVAEDTSGVDQPLVNWKGQWQYGQNWGYEWTFMVGPVPVNVGLYANAYAGLGWEAGIKPIQVFGQVGPLASAGVAASASAGIKNILEVGARAELVLIEISAPAQGKAELLFTDEGYPYLNMDIRADLAVETLKGWVIAFAKYPQIFPPKIKKVKKTIFTWNGHRSTKSIMNWGMTLGYHKTEVRGSLIEQMDVNQANNFQEQILKDERARTLESYLTDTNSRLDSLSTSISADITSAPSVPGAVGAVQTTSLELANSLATLSQTATEVSKNEHNKAQAPRTDVCRDEEASETQEADGENAEGEGSKGDATDVVEEEELRSFDPKTDVCLDPKKNIFFKRSEALAYGLALRDRFEEVHGKTRGVMHVNTQEKEFAESYGNIVRYARAILMDIQRMEYGAFNYRVVYNAFLGAPNSSSVKTRLGGIIKPAASSPDTVVHGLTTGIIEKFDELRKDEFEELINFVVNGGDHEKKQGDGLDSWVVAEAKPREREVVGKRTYYKFDFSVSQIDVDEAELTEDEKYEAIMSSLFSFEDWMESEELGNFDGLFGMERIGELPSTKSVLAGTKVYETDKARNPPPYTDAGRNGAMYKKFSMVPPKVYRVKRKICLPCKHTDNPRFYDINDSGFRVDFEGRTGGERNKRDNLLWHWGNNRAKWTRGCFIFEDYEATLRPLMNQYQRYVSGREIDFIVKDPSPELFEEYFSH